MPTTFSIAATDSSPGVGNIDDVARDLFGLDIMFSDDLKLTRSGDYLTWEGREVVRQAIYRRLMVAPGEYAVRPEYGVGLPNYVKKRSNRATMDQLRTRIQAQLARESRIDQVVDVVVEPFTTSAATGIKVYVKVSILGQAQAFGYEFTE